MSEWLYPTPTAPEVAMDLIPSLAFTALLELHPTFGQMAMGSAEESSLMIDLIQVMRDAFRDRHPDLWQVASEWISERSAVVT
jgi:hypothetical protein